MADKDDISLFFSFIAIIISLISAIISFLKYNLDKNEIEQNLEDAATKEIKRRVTIYRMLKGWLEDNKIKKLENYIDSDECYAVVDKRIIACLHDSLQNRNSETWEYDKKEPIAELRKEISNEREKLRRLQDI